MSNNNNNSTSLKLIYRAGDSKPLRVYIAAEVNGNKTAIEFDPWKAASCSDHSSSSSSSNKNNKNKNTGAVLQKTTSASATLFIALCSSSGEVVKGTSMNSALLCVRDGDDASFVNFRDLDERELGLTVGTCCAEKSLDTLMQYISKNEKKLKDTVPGIFSSSASTQRTNSEIAFFSSVYPVFANGAEMFGKTSSDASLTKQFKSIETWFNAFLKSSSVQNAMEKAKTTPSSAFLFAAQEAQNVSDLKNAYNPPADPSKDAFSLTTAINYANGAPHMGHAYEGLSADVIARYHRAYGRPTLFQTGADEHGQKISDAAAAVECKPIELCDKHVKMFQDLNKTLRIENDVYNRTTSEKHKQCCRELFERSEKNGDIYLDTYSGWYNVREETFVTETEAKEMDYKDPVSGKPLKQMEEESFFFRQSKYQARLIEHIENHPEFIQPEGRKGEILYRLKNDELRDLSVSRTTFDWGIPVPGNSKHVLYVWFDALTNYLTGCDFPNGENYSKFWPANVHIIGKDIIWFHCVIWPCMLMSCNIALPKAVFAHGFVTAADGQKMSKSIGNVVDPLDVLKRCSPDTFRYALMRNGIYGSDIPFSEESMTLIHNADLADTLGNLVHRATHLCSKNCEGRVPDVPIFEKVIDVGLLRLKTERAMESFQLQQACELAINSAKAANKYITDAEPWKLKGEETKHRRDVIIRTTLEAVYITALFLQPYIPTACEDIFKKLGMDASKVHKLWELKPFGENVKPGTQVAVGEVLFQKHEIDTAELFKKAQSSKEEKAAKLAKKKKGEENTKMDVTRLDLVVGEITKVWNHPDADTLYVENININGDKPLQVCSGLVKHIPIDKMLNARVVLVANMKPTKMRGVESEAMVLCATDPNDSNKVEIVTPPKGAAIGERVTFDGYENDPDEKLNPKKKVFEAVQPDFLVNKDGIATYKNVPFQTTAGPCSVESIREGGSIR